MGQRTEQLARRPWRGVLLAARHPLRCTGALVWRVVEDEVFITAAAMAYYFFFSLFPFVLFVIALVSMAPVQGLEDWLLGQAAWFIPGEAYALLEKVIRGFLGKPRSGLVSIGAVLALWTASSAFVAVTHGLSRAYRAPEHRTWWQVRLQAIGLTIALSLLMIVTFVLSIFGGQLGDVIGRIVSPAAGLAAKIISWSIVIGAVVIVTAAIDYACPATVRHWRWVTPGSLVFILGFAATSAAFSYYVGHFATYDATYGSLGAVIILILWMYILAAFLLFGSEVNAHLEQIAREHEEARAAARARAGSGEPASRGELAEA